MPVKGDILVKKGLMMQIWRIQQVQAIVGLLFWSLTLAGVYYISYFHDHLVNLGILGEGDVALGTALLFAAIIIGFLVFGLIYDRVFKLWREQTDVLIERNPYTREKLTPKEVIQWRRSFVPIMKELAKKDSQMEKDVVFMEKWIEKSILDYKELEYGVKDLEKWVTS